MDLMHFVQQVLCLLRTSRQKERERPEIVDSRTKLSLIIVTNFRLYGIGTEQCHSHQ